MISSDIALAREMTVVSVGLAGPAQQPTDNLRAHPCLPRQLGLREPQNLAPLVQRAHHAVDGNDA